MAISKVQGQAEAIKVNAEMEKMKQRAARQAARGSIEAQEIPMVQVVILPKGDGKVSMGEHFGALGDAHYEEGETPTFQLPIAVGLYDRGYANFEGAKQASADAKEARLTAARERREAIKRAAEDVDEDE